MRSDPDIQFEPIVVPPRGPEELNWFERLLMTVFDALGGLLAPLGRALGISWPVLQWVLLGALIVFVAVLALRTIGPLSGRNRPRKGSDAAPEWQPEREHSIALLEDADRLAADGRFDEATRLLLTRSVGQIASARPEWVEPSSTARELSALPALSQGARAAFATIAGRVESSLFALRALDRSDWEAARAAYSSFALASIEGDRAGGTAA